MPLGYLSPYRSGSVAPPGPGANGSSLLGINREINRMFDALFDQGGDSGTLSPGMLAPALDVHQADDKIEITAELPGVNEADIDLTVEDGVLTLRGEKRSQRSDEARGYTERSYGTFVRRIALPPTVDESACSAEFKNGVLAITLPISEQKSRGRKIELGGGKSTGSEAALSDRDEKASSTTKSAKSKDKGSSKAQA